MRRQKRASCTKRVVNKKMALIQAIKAKFVGKKNAVASMPKISQEFGQIFKSDDKTWHVDS